MNSHNINDNNNNNDLNYILYKKCFNNIVIFKKIKFFLKYKDWGQNNYNYWIYNDISESFNIKDIKIENLIKTKKHDLIDYVFQFYFNVAVHEPLRYWYCNIQIKDKQDLQELLRYRPLGFERFKLFFTHFHQNFIDMSEGLLSDAAQSGNIQIFNYLKNYTINDETGGIGKKVFITDLDRAINYYFRPSFKEFKYLVENNMADQIKDIHFKGILKHAGCDLHDLDYLKYILNYFISIKTKITIPVCLFDSKHQIVKYLLYDVNSEWVVKPSRSELQEYYPINAFFGDIETAKIYYNLPKDHLYKVYFCYSKENNSGMPILYNAARNGYFDLVKYLAPLFPDSLDFSDEILNFELFQYFLERGYIQKQYLYYNSLNVYSDENYVTELKKRKISKMYHRFLYLYQEKNNVLLSDCKVLLDKDVLLLKQFLSIDSLTTCSATQIHYESNNFKIFSKLVIKLLSTDNYKIIKAVLKSKRKPSKVIFKKTYLVSFIRSILSMKHPKVLYLLYKYDLDFLTDNLDLISQQIIQTSSTSFLNQILKLDYFSLKAQLFINTIIYLLNNFKTFKKDSITSFFNNIDFSLIDLPSFKNNLTHYIEQFEKHYFLKLSKNNISKYNIFNIVSNINNINNISIIYTILNSILSFYQKN
ncbi:hypothetical protein DICPUDRAFT_151875 [Dictyostelium purpureum]|uniref:Ankyrin repeat protein n=1 Tax=Dictyostelium purpureum TaxID=5786 RepID=F0ZJZ2_DICPU|nr:uncharacterized protein DICPUDRAFT_151875 [Dictyostelium purpureum]EGC35730.1 hypothetical protein DICPUDRAFT_151875 [Dictyostelium purpureum]|eukprot:XP_003287733.1 hypothetical protein DICPUDRAFT_151875 [Dictyostelium purpureum]